LLIGLVLKQLLSKRCTPDIGGAQEVKYSQSESQRLETLA